MRVGLFTDTYFPQVSGVATSIKTLKEELENLGHEVIIFTTTDPKADKTEHGIVRLPSIPFVSFKDRRIVIRGLIHAYEVAKDYQLDIIHTHTEFGVGILGRYVAYRMAIPIVHTYHTMYEDYLHYLAKGKILKPSHVRLVTRRFCAGMSGIVCPSQRVLDKLREYDLSVPMEIIPTGINLAQFTDQEVLAVDIREKYNIAPDQELLLSLSRLSYEKNIQAIIQGLPNIISKKANIHLLIVGDGPYRNNLEEMVKQLALEEYVTFVGEVTNNQVANYYQAADVYVSASASESQGLTYIEAMAAKTPLVAKGNAYLDYLISDASLGKLYAEDQDFAQAYLDYRQTIYPTDAALLQQKLDEISSVTFGKKVHHFYEHAQQFFDLKKTLEAQTKKGPAKRLVRATKIGIAKVRKTI